MVNSDAEGSMVWREGFDMFLCVQPAEGEARRICSLHTNFCTDGYVSMVSNKTCRGAYVTVLRQRLVQAEDADRVDLLPS
jgi:hypothetical protein